MPVPHTDLSHSRQERDFACMIFAYTACNVWCTEFMTKYAPALQHEVGRMKTALAAVGHGAPMTTMPTDAPKRSAFTVTSTKTNDKFVAPSLNVNRKPDADHVPAWQRLYNQAKPTVTPTAGASAPIPPKSADVTRAQFSKRVPAAQPKATTPGVPAGNKTTLPCTITVIAPQR